MPKVRKKASSKSVPLQEYLRQNDEKEYFFDKSKSWFVSWYDLIGRLYCKDMDLSELYRNLCEGNIGGNVHGGYLQDIIVEKNNRIFIELRDTKDANTDPYFIRMWISSNHIWIKYLGFPY